MGSRCPSQKAQPRGAKLKPQMRISAMNGSAMTRLLRLRRKDTEEGDDEIERHERHAVLVRTAAADGGHGTCRHIGRGLPGSERVELRRSERGSGYLATRGPGAGRLARRQHEMAVRWQMLRHEGDALHPAGIADRMLTVVMKRRPPAKIRHRERALPVA